MVATASKANDKYGRNEDPGFWLQFIEHGYPRNMPPTSNQLPSGYGRRVHSLCLTDGREINWWWLAGHSFPTMSLLIKCHLASGTSFCWQLLQRRRVTSPLSCSGLGGMAFVHPPSTKAHISQVGQREVDWLEIENWHRPFCWR